MYTAVDVIGRASTVFFGTAGLSFVSFRKTIKAKDVLPGRTVHGHRRIDQSLADEANVHRIYLANDLRDAQSNVLNRTDR